MTEEDQLTEEEQIALVRKEWYKINFIENQSEAVQLAAVRENGYAVQFTKNPSDVVMIAAIKILDG